MNKTSRLKTFALERCVNRRQIVITPCIGIVLGIEYKVRIAIAWLYWGFYITLGQKTEQRELTEEQEHKEDV